MSSPRDDVSSSVARGDNGGVPHGEHMGTGDSSWSVNASSDSEPCAVSAAAAASSNPTATLRNLGSSRVTLVRGELLRSLARTARGGRLPPTLGLKMLDADLLRVRRSGRGWTSTIGEFSTDKLPVLRRRVGVYGTGVGGRADNGDSESNELMRCVPEPNDMSQAVRSLVLSVHDPYEAWPALSATTTGRRRRRRRRRLGTFRPLFGVRMTVEAQDAKDGGVSWLACDTHLVSVTVSGRRSRARRPQRARRLARTGLRFLPLLLGWRSALLLRLAPGEPGS